MITPKETFEVKVIDEGKIDLVFDMNYLIKSYLRNLIDRYYRIDFEFHVYN